MTLVSWLPNGVVLVLWGVGATLGFAWVAARLAVAVGLPAAPDGGPGDRRRAARAAVRGRGAVRQPRRLVSAGLRRPAAGGAARLVAADAGRRPASRSRSSRSPSSTRRRCCCGSRCEPGASAAVRRRGCSPRPSSAGLAIVAVSLLVGGIQPWIDYVQVVRGRRGRRPRRCPEHRPGLAHRAGDRARRRRAALDPGRRGRRGRRRRPSFAAMRVRDPILSLGIVVTASLVTLPVTWYHYPVALMPVAAALAIRYRTVAAVDRRWRSCWPTSRSCALPLVWVAVAVVLCAPGGDPARGGRGRAGRAGRRATRRR